MKATKYLAMAAAALAFAACSNEELASVGQQPAANGMKPVEFTTAVSNQTRSQIMGESDLSTYWVQTTGTFYKADGDPIVNPKLTLNKVGGAWTYKVNNDAEASMLYWPMEDYSSTFAAWYYEGGSLLGTFDNSTAQKDAIGAYATHTSNDEGNTVGLDFKHAVSKAVFQARLLGSENNLKVQIDIQEVALHNVAHAATYTLIATDGSNVYSFVKSGVNFENGKYYEITVKMMPGVPLAHATAGMVVGTDGKAYNVNYYPSGVTAAGVVVYNSDSHGLVLALKDETNPMTQTAAMEENGAAAHEPAVPGYSWRLPSTQEWETIMKAYGTVLESVISEAEDGEFLKLSTKYWTSDSKYIVYLSEYNGIFRAGSMYSDSNPAYNIRVCFEF